MGGGRQTRRSVLVKDMASVHLSISKHSQLSSLSTRGEVIPFFLFSSASLSSLPLLISAFPLLLQPFLPFICHPPLHLYTSLPLSLFFASIPPSPFPQSHSTLVLAPPSFPSPMLSMEQPIQQQNKAAYSITRWLIKQDQNSAALRSTRQHYDTVLHWREEVSLMRRTRGRRGGMEESETAEYTQDTGQKQQN